MSIGPKAHSWAFTVQLMDRSAVTMGTWCNPFSWWLFSHAPYFLQQMAVFFSFNFEKNKKGKCKEQCNHHPRPLYLEFVNVNILPLLPQIYINVCMRKSYIYAKWSCSLHRPVSVFSFLEAITIWFDFLRFKTYKKADRLTTPML